MRRGSDPAPLHRGRHRAVRPDQVGRALRRALVATVAPALVLAAAAWIFVKAESGKALDVALNTDGLLWLIIGIVVVWTLWVALICRTYARHRAHTASRPLRIAGAFGVLVMCAAVTAPMAVGARVVEPPVAGQPAPSDDPFLGNDDENVNVHDLDLPDDGTQVTGALR